MTDQRCLGMITGLTILAFCAWPAPAAEDTLSSSDVLMRALVDELTRALKLRMEDLEQPYFIQYGVDDSISYDLSARYGAITSSQRERSRRFYSRVRVGAYELDNTNFAGEQGLFAFFGGGAGGGGQATLPLDDDYRAIRQAIWKATDDDYKEAVETLTKKRAYLKDKTIEDRPNDFTKAEPVEKLEPGAVLRFDKAQWEENLRRISAQFKAQHQVQDSNARLLVGAGNEYVVNSEGTRVRIGETGVLLLITAEVQAEDGMRIAGSRSYAGETVDELPPLDKILADMDMLVKELTAAMQAPIIERYTGPVLFDGLSAAQMFRVMLADGVVGKVEPVGTQRRSFEGAENLEKKLGQRILPKSFQVYDDPTAKRSNDTPLLGHYRYDHEGVPARRVDLVVDGVLKDMCLSRVPTRKLSGSNGHARRAPNASEPQAAVGCLFVKDDNGLSDRDLKAALIQAAKEEGLEYAVRIASVKSTALGASRSEMFSFFMRLQQGRGGGIGDPVVAYKVYVSDGHEEPFRGCEFGQAEVAALKKITGAGDAPAVYNYVAFGMGGATPPSTIVAPSVLFSELELSKIEQEHDKLPILKAPLAR
ncbi:MAG: metallopeptidase TldD-related protein [Planctomycetota bacterium]